MSPWKSRKLWMSVLVMALILFGFMVCGHPKDLYAGYCMSVLAAAGLFKAANVMEKRITSQGGK